MTRPRNLSFFLLGLLFITLSACGQVSSPNTPSASSTALQQTLQPVLSTPTERAFTPGTTTHNEEVKIHLCDCLPESLVSQIDLGGTTISNDPASESVVEIGPLTAEAQPDNVLAKWIYLLVAPFPTIQDGANLQEVKSAWLDDDRQNDFIGTLLVSESTSALFNRLWGPADPAVVKILPSVKLLQTAWETENAWAIIPFEDLDPRWKVMQINDVSPLQSRFDMETYALTVPFGLISEESGTMRSTEALSPTIQAPATNYESGQLASVIMTGTTALVRYTALRMEENGVLYPAQDIAGVLQDADITHISNEVSFWKDCPPAKPVRVEARFCSDPAYFALLEHIGADVIELTGNHILDWSTEPFLETLQLYKEQGIPYYGGGADLAEASRPLTLQAGNQNFTFIGCSPAGPASVWADEDKPGSNPCREGWMGEQISQALQAGSIPIVTYQHLEVEDYIPHSSQRIDFQQAARQGAVIVSGSQSHFAQSMTFLGDRFIHYGLGNLFFDQMYGENRHEFVDKHYFYKGKYISTELITLQLEDAARPRLMTDAEREDFLEKIFGYCNWETVFEAASE